MYYKSSYYYYILAIQSTRLNNKCGINIKYVKIKIIFLIFYMVKETPYFVSLNIKLYIHIYYSYTL